MTIDLDKLVQEMTDWRRDLHAHPEFGFEEMRTSAFVASKLREFGLDDVTEGVGGTGVVGTLKRGSGNRAIALRADMDALRIPEQSEFSHRSGNPGVMHACGHDGHTTMLLGAAKLLAEEGGFDGTVRFVFQPAEEWGRGALAMLDDGLMERFPFEEIYGLHNAPKLPVGRFQTRTGPIMSAEDNFEIVLTGVGGHAARPHVGNETLVAACALVTSLQTIVSRRLDITKEPSVVTVGAIHGGNRDNIIPDDVMMLGTIRAFDEEQRNEIHAHVKHITEMIAAAGGARARVEIRRGYDVTVNHPALTEWAIPTIERIAGNANVGVIDKVCGAEDFSFFQKEVPGLFWRLGCTPPATAIKDSAPGHSPRFYLDEDCLKLGVKVQCALALDWLSANK